MKLPQYILGRLLVTIFSLGFLASCANGDTEPVQVKLIAVNDFHGYILRSELLTLDVPDPDGGPKAEVYVGGAAYLASLVRQLRADNPNSLFLGVGDLVGGSPAASSWTMDEATIEALNLMGMEMSTVGNHEFDRGTAALKRLQNGGCATIDHTATPNLFSCARGTFSGAKFAYMAANVTEDATGKLLFPATQLRRFNGVTVGFIGLPLRDTPKTTRGAGGLTFADEISVINTQATRLKQEGADAVVVLLHNGGATTASSLVDQTCPGLSGQVKTVVEALSSQVDVVLSAHTHYDYVCQLNGILLSQAGSYGRFVTDVNLTIAPGKGVMAKTAANIPVINDLTTKVPRGYAIQKPDAEVAALVDFYDNLTRPKRTREIGYIASDIARVDTDGAGNVVLSGTRVNVADHPVGRVMADAFLNATGPNGERGDIAFINPGGLRNYLPFRDDGKVDYEVLFAAAPFGNALLMLEMTGESLVRLLEQQWEAANCAGKQYKGICGRVLQPSSTLTYTWKYSADDQGKPSGTGALVDISTIRINSQPISLTQTYKIVTVEFLASGGGDNFTDFLNRRTSLVDMAISDLDALIDYFKKYPSSSPLAVPAPRVSCVMKSDGSDCGIPVLR